MLRAHSSAPQLRFGAGSAPQPRGRGWPRCMSTGQGRRVVLSGLAAGALAVGVQLLVGGQRQGQAPVRSVSATAAASGSTSPGGGAMVRSSGNGSGGGPQLPRAVNLRDLGEAAPGIVRPGILFRCSQVYSPDVLRELGVRTVVDLRGRAEHARAAASRHPRRSPAPSQAASPGAEPTVEGAAQLPVAPGPLLSADQLERLSEGGQGSVLEGEGAGAEIVAMRRAQRGSTGGASDEGSGVEEQEGVADAATGSMSPALSSAQLVKALEGVGGDTAVAAVAGTTAVGPLQRLSFDVIPAREFAHQMLRMPGHVWAAALGNLLTLRDPRRPFVEAFANDQLMGFTRYYAIILEHAKTSIAAVLRVFARDGSLPALVHCAHGKDRTGVVVMLLLAVCGVPRETIVADYVESERQLRAFRESLNLPPAQWAVGAPIPLSDVIIASTEGTMRALLLHLEQAYPQGVDSYLESCGLIPQDIANVRRNLMTPQALAALEAQTGGHGGRVGWPGAGGQGADEAGRK